MSTPWIFILGREPALSLAEIMALLKRMRLSFHIEEITSGAALVACDTLDADALMNELGGTIKIGKVLALDNRTPRPQNLFPHLLTHAETHAGKFSFGLSGFGVPISKKLGLECKRLLREAGVSARYVEGRGDVLSAPQIKHYKLLTSGAELLLVKTANGFVVARTQAVQPFDRFSDRDYGRPARDAQSGMLPPKVARMMINLAQCPKNGLLIDPFCGSGTILIEAALMGYERVMGSDNSEKAVQDTKKNIAWATPDKLSGITIQQHDALTLDTLFKKSTVDAIVTEPYLGPPLKGNETLARLQTIQKELQALYGAALNRFARVLKKNGRLVMVVPAFPHKKEWLSPLSLADIQNADWTVCEVLPVQYSKNVLPVQPPLAGALWWHRPGQHLGRQIVVLQLCP